ncbi:hypothetical protein ACFOG5_20655 [Pedobacter fastidiosus]|uniref:SprT-like family protein n=1 Tax=Pedobacter fastidiosus TaxID=2765361 RepID=A0ABR7KU02_9SPHI|nr:hypothetical protein [Pedobacter fastidiosus]MBC6111597.1 hypothetical protein [Pedobacter fastidiosus]
MKSIFYRISIVLILLSTVVYFSCRKENLPSTDQEKLSDPLAQKALEWFKENSALPVSTYKLDINVREYEPDWKHFRIDTGSNGVAGITIPLIKKASNKVNAFYTEIGLILGKDGTSIGMIKEYIGNPYVGETQLNLYTGSGRLFDRGLYNAISRTFTSALKKQNVQEGTSGNRGLPGERLMSVPNSYMVGGGEGGGGSSSGGTNLGSVEIHGTSPITGGGGSPPVTPGGTGGWVVSGGGTSGSGSSSTIKNNVKDPCLKAMVQAAIDKGIEFTTENTLNSIFDIGSKVNLNFIQAAFSDDLTDGGATKPKVTYNSDGSINTFDMTIKLNEKTMPNASKEYISATILHEALHAYFTYLDNGVDFNPASQHVAMATDKYILWFEKGLKSIYPEISDLDLKALAWGGLEGTEAYDSLKEKNPYEVGQMWLTNSQHHDGTKGTKCGK